MKATGIVRRIDELGRVVIPKEIRKTLRIAEGTPLEIYTEKDALVLRKYSPITSLEDDAKDFIGTLGEITERKCLLTDNEKIVCVSSPDLKNCQGAAITEEFSALIREKKSALINGDTGSAVAVARGMDKYVSEVAVPVLSDGEVIGAVVMLEENAEKPFDGADVKLALLGACFLARKFN